MRTLPPRFTHRIFLVCVLALAAFLFFVGAEWGIPSRAVLERVKPVEEPLTAFAARLAAERSEPGAEGWIAFNVACRAEEAAAREKGVADEILRLRAARSFLLASESFEESLVLAALSGLDPARGRIDPGVYQYGGAHLYTVASALKLASVLGYVRLVPDVRYYLERPDEMGCLYTMGRYVAALAGILAVLATFQLGAACGGGMAGAAAALLVALSPLVVAHAHMMRSHLFALPWALWALFWMVRLKEAPSVRKALWAGACGGLAAGSVLYHAALLLPLAAAHLLGGGGAGEKAKRFAISLGSALVVFALANPCLVLSPETLVHEWRDHGADFAGRSVFGFDGGGAVRLFAGVLPQALGPVGFFLALAGILALAWRPDQWILTAAFLPALAGLLFRRGHTPEDFAYARFGLLVIPIGAVWAGIWVARRVQEWRMLLGMAAGALFVIQIPMCLAYVWNFREAAGPRSTAANAARVLAQEIPAGALVAFDALPHPADTPAFDLWRFDVRFAPGALPAGDIDYWVVSETCPAAWRQTIEASFAPWKEIRKTPPFYVLLPFRDRFAMANRDFVIYRRK